jgi:hypothetical protein
MIPVTTKWVPPICIEEFIILISVLHTHGSAEVVPPKPSSAHVLDFWQLTVLSLLIMYVYNQLMEQSLN